MIKDLIKPLLIELKTQKICKQTIICSDILLEFDWFRVYCNKGWCETHVRYKWIYISSFYTIWQLINIITQLLNYSQEELLIELWKYKECAEVNPIKY